MRLANSVFYLTNHLLNGKPAVRSSNVLSQD